MGEEPKSAASPSDSLTITLFHPPLGRRASSNTKQRDHNPRKKWNIKQCQTIAKLLTICSRTTM